MGEPFIKMHEVIWGDPGGCKGQDKKKTAIANLPKVKAPTEWLMNLEYRSYLQKLDELKITP